MNAPKMQWHCAHSQDGVMVLGRIKGKFRWNMLDEPLYKPEKDKGYREMFYICAQLERKCREGVR